MNTEQQTPIDPTSLLRPRRKITGMSAILLPITTDGKIDWPGLRQHVIRTFDAGLTPAVNMDTGYANLIDEPTRTRVLNETQTIAAGRSFVAGAYVADAAGDGFNGGAYQTAIDAITQRGGTPILFQSFGLTELADDKLIDAYQTLASNCDDFYFFELGTMFAPFGKIYGDDVYRELIKIPNARGAKHSSLRREPEWRRLMIRDAVRPEFKVLTGNDLAIDMVMYGSDYLLGLSTFAPDAFAMRDAMWTEGDAGFYELNDWLQYLGMFAFRETVSAYKHSAAMFLKLRGWIDNDDTMAGSPTRPNSDRQVLTQILESLPRNMN